ncbi:MAG: glycosyltransferase [bacterium]
MIRADLHVHSCHSRHASEWFLQRIGAQESYTDVETVYRDARQRGANFVTLTDHNSIAGALELVARHPADCFVSTEATTYFPEDGCKVHVLCYGITPVQFEMIQERRENIYNLRDYLRAENIACSVAHATFSINGRLTVEHIEKLLLLFDVFEGINGTRGRFGNIAWQEVLRHLTPAHIARLSQKHQIAPWGAESWIKGITGGSDDHAALFIGATYTQARATTIPEFLAALRAKRTLPGGRYGDHKALAYAIFKVASEYARRKGGAKGWPGLLASILFDEKGPALRDRLLVKKLGLTRSTRDRILSRFFKTLLEVTRTGDTHGPDWQVEQAYAALTTLLDECIAETVGSLERSMRGEESSDMLQYLSVALPATLFAAPFFSTLYYLHRSREINSALLQAFVPLSAHAAPRVLWFSDTLTDLNGVSVTLREVAECARTLKRPLHLVGCLTPEEQQRAAAVPEALNLPCIFAVTPEFYNAHTLRVPSLLQSIDRITAHHPDRIVVSTPGPVGLVGLLAARLLGVPCTGIYHTDFGKQAEAITSDPQIASLVDSYTRWFFARTDELRVPSMAYIKHLTRQGMDPQRMKLFPRGLDQSFTVLDPQTLEAVRKRWFADGRPTLLYAGRLGQEKNLGLLLHLLPALRARGLDVRIVLAGDGPARDALQKQAAESPDIVFAGRVERSVLRAFYALADIFVFPSTTDTFGMAVLEAQAFGLPAVVADAGGPPEIVRQGRTGYAVAPDDPEIWLQTLTRMIQARQNNPSDFSRWRAEIRAEVRTTHNWETLLDDIMGPRPVTSLAQAAEPCKPWPHRLYGASGHPGSKAVQPGRRPANIHPSAALPVADL